MFKVKAKPICLFVLVILIATLSLVACGQSETTTSISTETPQAESITANNTTLQQDEANNSFPITVKSCDEPFRYESAPERVVVFDVNMTEIMLALGLEGKVVAYWLAGSQIGLEYSDQLAVIPKEFTESWPPPSLEMTLGENPDFVFGGWGYAFSEESGLTPAKLQEAGVNSYAIQESCGAAGVSVNIAIDRTYEDILNIGRIFAVEDKAQALVDQMRTTVDDVTQQLNAIEQPMRVMYYGGGEESPFTVGQYAMPNNLIQLAGGENIFMDAEEDWFNASWEEVIARNPDVIVVQDADWGAAEDHIVTLQSLPQLASVNAIQIARFVVLPYRFATPSLLNAEAVRILAEGFYPEQFQ